MSSPVPPASVMFPAPAVSASFPEVPTRLEPTTELENQCVEAPLATSASTGGSGAIAAAANIIGAAVCPVAGAEESCANTTLDCVTELAVTPLSVNVSPPPKDMMVSAPDCFTAEANEEKSEKP